MVGVVAWASGLGLGWFAASYHTLTRYSLRMLPDSTYNSSETAELYLPGMTAYPPGGAP